MIWLRTERHWKGVFVCVTGDEDHFSPLHFFFFFFTYSVRMCGLVFSSPLTKDGMGWMHTVAIKSTWAGSGHTAGPSNQPCLMSPHAAWQAPPPTNETLSCIRNTCSSASPPLLPQTQLLRNSHCHTQATSKSATPGAHNGSEAVNEVLTNTTSAEA